MVLDLEELAELYKQEKNVRLKERYHALYFLALDYSIAETARLFLREEDTIRSWKEQWESEHTVIDEPRSGRGLFFQRKIKNSSCS